MGKVKSAVEIFEEYALSYQTKYMSVEKYHDSLDLFCESLSHPNATILELACGPGNITKYLLSQSPKLKILGTDLSLAMLDLARANNPSANFQLLDCRSISKMNSTYDAILCGFGLPYVTKEDAIQMIQDASSSLNDGGLIYLSTMEDDYSKSGFRGSSSNSEEGLIMYFHESGYLLEALKINGFQIVDVSRVQYPDANGEDFTDLIIIGKK